MLNIKQQLRISYKWQRSQISAEYRASAATTIAEKLKSLTIWHNAYNIGLYHAVCGEVDLAPLYKLASEQQKCCYFPTIKDNNTLLFLPVTTTTKWCTNYFGILEPKVSHDARINPSQLDILCMPLVAFDSRGTRLGMGKGYYDKTLAKNRPKYCIGVAYELQYHSNLPRDTWDIPLSLVITEKNIYTI